MAKLTALQKKNIARIRKEKHNIACSIIDVPPKNDEFFVAVIRYRDGGEYGGYHENNIEVTQKSDGALFFSGEGIDGGFIYFYPKQVPFLKKFLRKLAYGKKK